MLLDAVFREHFAAFRKPVQEFFHKRIGVVLDDLEWIHKVAENHKVDTLMPTACTIYITRIARGFKPKLVLPGHEQEMGHNFWDRLPFWGDDKYLKLNYNQLKSSSFPVVVLT